MTCLHRTDHPTKSKPAGCHLGRVSLPTSELIIVLDAVLSSQDASRLLKQCQICIFLPFTLGPNWSDGALQAVTDKLLPPTVLCLTKLSSVK